MVTSKPNLTLRERHSNPPLTLTLQGGDEARRASLLRERGQVDDAEAMLRSTLAAQQMALGEAHEYTLRSAVALASVLHRKGEPEEARALVERSLAHVNGQVRRDADELLAQL